MKNPRAYQSYFGGKSGNGTYQTIINHVPPHLMRYSLFAGNDALTVHMKRPEIGLILADLDRDVINAWEVELIKQKDEWWVDNVYLYLNSAIDILSDFERRKISFAVADKDTFIFLDPPYLLDTRKSQRPVYKHEMTKQQHIDLLEIITQQEMCEYKIMICCYPNDLYHSYLGGWEYVDYYSTIRNGVALERIYMNYKLDGKLHDYRYLGGNFRERERIKRISGNLLKKLKLMAPEHRNAVVAEIVNSLNAL